MQQKRLGVAETQEAEGKCHRKAPSRQVAVQSTVLLVMPTKPGANLKATDDEEAQAGEQPSVVHMYQELKTTR